MVDLTAIRARHEQEAEYRQVCPCSLCVKHEDRGALLAYIAEREQSQTLDALTAESERLGGYDRGKH